MPGWDSDQRFRITMRARGGQEVEIESELLVCVCAMVDELSITATQAYSYLIDAMILYDHGLAVDWPYELKIIAL